MAELTWSEHGERPSVVDVAILGSGPAGAVVALTLAHRGLNVLLIERSTDEARKGAPCKVGESLPPSAKPLLQVLGVWQSFQKDSHLPCYGNRSAWGSQSLHELDFIFHPHGHGWHLDRSRFDAMLVGAALEAGAVRKTETRLVGWHRDPHRGWRLDLQGAGRKWQAEPRFIVDATGRSGWFARCEGGPRQSYDSLVGIAALLIPSRFVHNDESCTMVEATHDGWWYSALLPDGRLILVFMTDADLAQALGCQRATCWWDQMQQTEHTRSRAEGYRLTTAPRLVCASSSRSCRIVGEDWLTVGDAAAAHDPLSAQGITAALAGGCRAARAIELHLAGDEAATDEYALNVEQSYAHYLRQHAAYYAMEQRWPSSAFWYRRAMESVPKHPKFVVRRRRWFQRG